MKPDMKKSSHSRNPFYVDAKSAMIAITLVGFGLMCRLWIETPNVQPVIAIALFGGMIFRQKWLAFMCPILVLAITDLRTGGYELSLLLSVYCSIALCGLIGWMISRNHETIRLGGLMGAATLSAILFFVFTNAAVWLFTSWYQPTLAGMLACYGAGLPFLKYTVLSTLFFAGLFYGVQRSLLEINSAITRPVFLPTKPKPHPLRR